MSPKADPEEIRNEVVGQVGLTRVDMKAVISDLKTVLDEVAPSGVAGKLPDFVDKEIVVWSVSPFRGSYGPAAFIVFTDEYNTLYNTVTGGSVVLPKLLMVMDRLPIRCTVRMIEGGQYGRYFDIE